jgi:flagellin
MSYSSGANGGSVFIDLTNNPTSKTPTAAITDPLTGTSTTLTVDTLSGTGAVVSNSITVGTGTGYANTAQGLINAINGSGLGLTASFTNAAVAGATSTTNAVLATDTGIMVQGSVGAGTNPTTASYSGSATATGAANTNNLTGSITFQVGTGAATTVTMAQVAAAEGKTAASVALSDLDAYINADAALGVTAGDATAGKLTLQSSAASDPALKVTSNLIDESLATGPAALTYTANAAYSDGLSGTVEDATIGGTASDPQTASSITLGTAGSGGGTATISFADQAGESLSASDLSTPSDAQAALTDLNSAIADVSAQDGYIGAQINTLNAVSNVISTQGENIQSAQNAVQATDYAQASSNMSKYEILSQTGISALAQANSVQQEVLKLLQ